MTQYLPHNLRRDNPEYGPRPAEHIMASRLDEVRAGTYDLHGKTARLPAGVLLHNQANVAQPASEPMPIHPAELVTPVAPTTEASVATVRAKLEQIFEDLPNAA